MVADQGSDLRYLPALERMACESREDPKILWNVSLMVDLVQPPTRVSVEQAAHRLEQQDKRSEAIQSISVIGTLQQLSFAIPAAFASYEPSGWYQERGPVGDDRDCDRHHMQSVMISAISADVPAVRHSSATGMHLLKGKTGWQSTCM